MTINHTPEKVGVIFGKFFPLHQGHLFMIDQAQSEVDQLYIFVCTETQRDLKLFLNSSLVVNPSNQQRLAWLQLATAVYDNVHIVHLVEDNLPSYPNGWLEWQKVVAQKFQELQITPDIVFTSEPQDVINYKKYLGLPSRLVDPKREFINISGTRCRTQVYTNYQFLFHLLSVQFALNLRLDLRKLLADATTVTTLLQQATSYNELYQQHWQLIKQSATTDNAEQYISAIQQREARLLESIILDMTFNFSRKFGTSLWVDTSNFPASYILNDASSKVNLLFGEVTTDSIQSTKYKLCYQLKDAELEQAKTYGYVTNIEVQYDPTPDPDPNDLIQVAMEPLDDSEILCKAIVHKPDNVVHQINPKAQAQLTLTLKSMHSFESSLLKVIAAYIKDLECPNLLVQLAKVKAIAEATAKAELAAQEAQKAADATLD